MKPFLTLPTPMRMLAPSLHLVSLSRFLSELKDNALTFNRYFRGIYPRLVPCRVLDATEPGAHKVPNS